MLAVDPQIGFIAQRLDDIERTAVDKGWVAVGDPLLVVPELQVLATDPRMAAIEATMLDTVNRDRAMVGLQPFDSDYQVVAES